MIGWTDPTLADGDTIQTEHITELREAAQVASLFAPHMDDRPSRAVSLAWQDSPGTAEFNVMNVTGSGVIRTLWFTTGVEGGWIRVYADGEATPRIALRLSELTMALNGAAAFHQDLVGLSAGLGTPQDFASGGYLNLPIPYHTGVRVTMQLDVGGVYFFAANYNHSATVDFDYGRYNYLNAARTRDASVSEFANHTLANITGKRGALYGIYQAMSNSTADVGNQFLEGDILITADGVLLPSSGTEDFYLGSWYWAGFTDIKQTLNRSTGVTVFDIDAPPYKWAGYRFLDVSPINFESSLNVVWENGEFDEENPITLGNTTASSVVYYYTEA